MKNQPGFFDFAAEVGLTKHIGGLEATEALVELKLPPPPEVIAWAAQDVGASVKPLTPDAWKGLLEAAGLKEQMGSVLVRLCWPYIALKNLKAAFEANREAEAVWRELGNLPMLIETYDMRQFLHVLSGEQKEVLAAESELLRLCRSIGNLMHQGNALTMIVDVHREQGRFGEAITDIRAAMAISDEIGNPVAKQGVLLYPVRLHLSAGALDQAEHWADKLYALQDSPMTVFQAAYFNDIARVKIACGKLGEGQAILDRALELCGTDHMMSHTVIWIAITDAYLQLALERPEYAFNRLEERVQSYRQAGFRFSLTEELLLRGRVHLALGEVEAAKEILLEAKTVAEEKEKRLFLWQILATLSDLERMSDDQPEAEKLGCQAREIVDHIAENAGSNALRDSFLAQPAVARVLTGS